MMGDVGALQAVIDAIDQPVFALDRELRYTAFNRAHADVMRALYGVEIALGGRLTEYQTVTADREAARANLERALAGEHVTAATFSGEEGRRRYFEVEHVPQTDAAGTVVGVIVRAHDVTERQRAETALQAGARELAAIYANVRDVMFHLAVEPDDRFRFVLVNPAFLQVTGLTEDQVVGKLFQEVIPEPAHALVLANYKEAVRTRKAVSWEEVSDYPTGKKYGEVSVAPVNDAEGTCTHLVGVVHDVTERQRAEEEIRRLNAELKNWLVDRSAQLDLATQELQAFAYAVSHDVRAPLRAIDGFSQMVIEDEGVALSRESVERLGRARSAAQTMGRLLDDLLGLSNVSQRDLLRHDVDLSALAEEVAEEVAADHASRIVETHIEPGLSAAADPALLRIILHELLGNAWKFTAEHERACVEVGAREVDGERAFYVRDDGAGFDMAHAEHLFGIFQHMHLKERFLGDAVGLATVQRLVRRHGGRVWAETEVEKGATFYFTLPPPTTSV